MTNIVILIVLSCLLLAALIVGLVYLILFLVRLFGGSTGGWNHLSTQYASTRPISGVILRHQTVQVGAVVYKRCVTIGIADEGLYVSIWRRTALLPWSEFKAVGQATLYWQKMPSVEIGDPIIATMTIPPNVFARMREKLPGLCASDT